MVTRPDGRTPWELRELRIHRRYLAHAQGSALIELGKTRLICSATAEARVPGFLRGRGTGWVTAEYGMLPASSARRIARETATGRIRGRTHEIQRLIGRSLRAVVDLTLLGERTITVDCDVVQADGGTRTAAITGGFVALYDAVAGLLKGRELASNPLLDHIAAVSIGIVEATPVLDLCYEEDSTAEVDMNLVMTGTGKIVEIQGTAEGAPFSKEQLSGLVDLGERGLRKIFELQKELCPLSVLS
jgi:ribonuclease PH